MSTAFSSIFLFEIQSEGYAIAHHTVIDVYCFQQFDFSIQLLQCMLRDYSIRRKPSTKHSM